MNKEVISIIDIGTLKTKVIIIAFDKERNRKTLYKDKFLTVLGKNINDTGYIEKHSIEKQLKALNEIMKKVNEYNVNEVSVIGTEGLRKAKNSKYVLEKIEALTKTPTRVLSHIDEAKLFFKAVASDFDEDIAVADIGGGSIQLTIGNKDKIISSYLLQTGGHVLQERFSKNNPSTKDEQENAWKYVNSEVEKLNIKKMPGIKLIYGSSCIIDFFTETGIKTQELTGHKFHPMFTTVNELKRFYDKLILLTLEERMGLFPSDPYYTWGADKAMINIFNFCEVLNTTTIVPTNMNISDGLMLEMIGA